jgi:outer membrane protein TolC
MSNLTRLCVGILFATIQVQAETVKLSILISEALHDSPTVQKSQAAYDEAHWKKVETYQGFLPHLDGSVNYITNKRYMLVDINFGGGPVSVPQILPTTIYTLTATLPLFDGFASTNRYWAGTNLESSAQHDLDWTRFSTARQVTLQFYRTLAAQALKDVAEQNLKTLSDHLRDVQALKKAGIATNYDVLRVEVQVSEARSEILNTTDNYDLARYKLGELLGKEVENRELEGKLPVLSEKTILQAKALKLEDRSDLKSLGERVQSLRDLDTAESRFWVPKIAAYGQYQYYNNLNDRFDDSDKFREAYNIGFSLTWNFFDGMGSIARWRQSAARAQQLDNTLHQANLKAGQDYEFWKRKLNYFKTVYDSRNVDIDKSSESIRLAREGRRAGTRTSTELLDAELDLFRARAGLVNAQIGVVESVINLELTTGQPVYDFN